METILNIGLGITLVVLTGLVLYALLHRSREAVIISSEHFTFGGTKKREDKTKESWYLIEGAIESFHDMYPPIVHIKFRVKHTAEKLVLKWDSGIMEYFLEDENKVPYWGTEILYA